MKFTCNKGEITDAVTSVQKAINAKSTIPLLEGINFTADDDKLIIYGTDNEIGIECVITASVEEAGSVVLNSKLIGDIVRNMPEGAMCVENVDNARVRLKSGFAKFELFVIQTDVFPSFPIVDTSQGYTIDQLTLKKMLTQTAFSIGTDETRKVMTGLYLESEGNEFRAVAVDGYRIALRKTSVMPGENEISLIIPSRTVAELIKVIPSTMGELKIYGGKKQTVITFGNCRVFTRLINGEFFNYKYILPNEYVTQTIVNREILLGAIERASVIISPDNVRRSPVVINVDNDAISVKTVSDSASGSDVIEVDMEGDPIKVAFNPRFLIDALKAIDDEQIDVRFTTRVGQCTIRPINNDSFLYLILPIKLND